MPATRLFSRPVLRRITGCLALALGIAATPALAGTEMQMTVHDLTGQGSAPLRTWAQDGKMRIEEGGDIVMIFRDDALYAVQPKDRSYHVMDRDSMQRIAERVNPALQRMRAQLAQLPPEQRAQMEKLISGQMPGMAKPPQVEVRHTSRTGSFAGHDCKYVEVLEDGVLSDELCVTDADDLQGADELMAAARQLSSLMKDMTQTIQAPGLLHISESYSAKFDELGGIPVLARHYVDGQPDSETRLESIRSQALPADLFEIPAGYTRKDMFTGR